GERVPRRDAAGGCGQARTFLLHVRAELLLDEADRGRAQDCGRGDGGKGARIPRAGRRNLRAGAAAVARVREESAAGRVSLVWHHASWVRTSGGWICDRLAS